MNGLIRLICLILMVANECCGKKAKKSNRGLDDIPMSEKMMFGSKSLKCLVCKAVVDEFEFAISKVDPKKKIETGSFRLASDGQRKSNVVAYARSEIHLNELVDNEFEEYVQAKEKSTGEATIIRLMDRKGGMNPRFSEIDIVPDEDLNTRLKFYCEGIVEEHEDDLFELFAAEMSGVAKEFCHIRTAICDAKNMGRDEL